MSVFKVENGKVVQVWRDVLTAQDHKNKYGPHENLFEGDASPGMLWDGSSLSTQQNAVSLEAKRASAFMSRSRFIIAALDAGILSEVDAEQAVNGWPFGWDAFFDGQPARDRIAAKAEWASITTVRRDAPLIAQLAAFKGLTDAQIDALFGIE
jgi:hypothetical protein